MVLLGQCMVSVHFVKLINIASLFTQNGQVQSELRQVQSEMARLNSQQKDIVIQLRNTQVCIV